MKAFYFPVEIVGYGDTADKAWNDAVTEFSLSPGETPTPSRVEVETEDGQWVEEANDAEGERSSGEVSNPSETD